MSSLNFNLDDAQVEDLVLVCSIGPEKLRDVASLVEKQPFTIIRSKIEKIIVAEVGKDEGETLCRVIFGIASTFRRYSTTAELAIKGVTRAIENLTDPLAELQKWNSCAPLILRLLNARSIVIASKAVDLSYDFENVFLRGRFINSIRPIFDDERNEILGTAVVQTLTLEYRTGQRPVSVCLALDVDDVEALKRECERALKKSHSIKSKIEDGWKLEVLISGEKEDE